MPSDTPSRNSLDRASLADLLARVEVLEARVSALEAPPGTPETTVSPEPLPELPTYSVLTALGWVGQVCLILAGAFFIRMLTDAGTLPRGLGVCAGLLYSGIWAWRADRSTPPARSVFLTSASALIAFPLLWEATTKFQVLGPPGAASTLVGITMVLMTVAWRKSLQSLAWLITLAALAEGLALMIATSTIEAFTAAFLALGLGSLWLTYGRRWQGLRWPVALTADASVLVLTLLCAWPGGPPEAYRGLSPLRVIFLALGLAMVYLGSFSLRILMRQRKVIFFETLQSALVLAVGFGGAVRVAHASGSGEALLGGAALLAGLGCYGVAFAFLERGTEEAWNFTFFTSLALALMLLGATILLGGPTLSLALLLLGITAVEAGLRTGRNTLLVHGGTYLLAASLASGLLSHALAAFLGQPKPAFWPFGWIDLLTLAALVATHVRMVSCQTEERWTKRLSSFGVGVLSIAGLGGLCFCLLVRGLAPLSLKPGVPAALRTAVLALLAMGLAGLAKAWPHTELRWLVFPVLAITGAKILLEDMPLGQAGPLVLGFALFGAALLVAPRLLRTP